MLRHLLRFTAPTALAAALAACAPVDGPPDLVGVGDIRRETLSDVLSAPVAPGPAQAALPYSSDEAQTLHIDLVGHGVGDREFARLSVDASTHGWGQARSDVASCWRDAEHADSSGRRTQARTVDELTTAVDLEGVMSCLSERSYVGVFVSSPIHRANGPFGGVATAPRTQTSSLELVSLGLRGLSTPTPSAPAPTPASQESNIEPRDDAAADLESEAKPAAIEDGPEKPAENDSAAALEPVASLYESKPSDSDADDDAVIARDRR